MPMDRFLSHLYVSKPSLLNCKDTRETWELSIACRLIPVELQSHVASFNKSLMASNTFLNKDPCTKRASNILTICLACSVLQQSIYSASLLNTKTWKFHSWSVISTKCLCLLRGKERMARKIGKNCERLEQWLDRVMSTSFPLSFHSASLLFAFGAVRGDWSFNDCNPHGMV